MSSELIFTVNPGATSTKCALYEVSGESLHCRQETVIEHPDAILAKFSGIAEQLEYRYQRVKQFLNEGLKANDRLIACAGRGGMLTPVPSGAILISQELVDFSMNTPVYQHASNLGAPLAYLVAKGRGINAYIVDPVSVDEFSPVARISGSPDFTRFSFVHALNTRATARKLAQQLHQPFEQFNAVVAHLGAGFSISAIRNGRIVDNDNRMEGGAFTPERAGGIPPIPLIDACFSGRYSAAQLKKKLYGEGGLYGYLGTRDLRDVEALIEQGDSRAQLIYDAMLYQIRKSMAAMASVLEFKLHGFILTGGLAYSKTLVASLSKTLEAVAPVYAFPGSNENQALAETTLRVVKQGAEFLTWPINMDALIGTDPLNTCPLNNGSTNSFNEAC